MLSADFLRCSDAEICIFSPIPSETIKPRTDCNQLAFLAKIPYDKLKSAIFLAKEELSMDKDFLKFMSFVAFMEAEKGSGTGLLCRRYRMAGYHPYYQKKA